MAKIDAFELMWYETQLKTLQEPSFSEFENSNAVEAYRFIWLRTSHNPVAVRVETQQDDTGMLFLKVGSGRGGYDPGVLKIEQTKVLTQEQMMGLRQIVESNKFRDYDPSRHMGLDGAEWIVAAKKGKECHYAIEWSPEEGSVRNIGLFLLELSAYEAADIY